LIIVLVGRLIRANPQCLEVSDVARLIADFDRSKESPVICPVFPRVPDASQEKNASPVAYGDSSKIDRYRLPSHPQMMKAAEYVTSG
jgi:hypothetical protein